MVDRGVKSESGIDEEAMKSAGARQVEADNLVRIIDALCNGLGRAQRVVERGVRSVSVDVAVELARAEVCADDVAEVVDAVRLR